MHHSEFLAGVAEVVSDRKSNYGEPIDTYTRAAVIANSILGTALTSYDLAVIMHAVKLSRMRTSPHRLDNYTDAVNFLAFAAEFSGAYEPPKRPEPLTVRDDP